LGARAPRATTGGACCGPAVARWRWRRRVVAAAAVAVAVAASTGGRTVVCAPRTRARKPTRTHARTYTRKYARARATPTHNILYVKYIRWGSFVVARGGSSCYCGWVGTAAAAASVANYPYSHARRHPRPPHYMCTPSSSSSSS